MTPIRMNAPGNLPGLPTDGEEVRAFLGGDEQAFERLVRLSYPELASDHDVVMGRQILANRERVRMHLESGIVITVTSGASGVPISL